MFERSLLVSQRSHASVQQRWTTVASITFQVGVAAVVIAVPLFHQEMPQLKIEAPKAFVQLKPPPKLVPVRVETRAASTAPSTPTPVQTQTVQFHAPPRIPIGIDMRPDNTPPTDFSKIGSGMSTGMSVGLGDVTSAPPTVVAAAPHVDKPRAVSAGVVAGMLLAPIRPVYPPIAKVTHTQGTVVVEAIISKAGRIESLNVVSGPPMLRESALAAIREARYQPYRLNGEPTEVQTTITVNFRMDG
jgi:protein TonB